MNGYRIEVDKIRESEWSVALEGFADSTIYQTWAYGQMRSTSLSHIVVKDGDEIISGAQIRLYKIPFIKCGIAYLHWGPLWKKKKERHDSVNVLSLLIDALVYEYAVRRGLYLKICPSCYEDSSEALSMHQVFEGAGFEYRRNDSRLLVMNLDKSVDQIRKGFQQKWRNLLNAAERNGVDIIEGYDDELIVAFSDIYKEMCIRKGFARPDSLDQFVKIFKRLPNSLRPRVIIGRIDHQSAAGGVFSTLGNTGIYLFGATNDLGMKCKASYLIQWQMIKWLIQNGFCRYDLSGINPESTPGTYHFKAGACGKNGTETRALGEFTICKNPISNLLATTVDKLRTRSNRSRQ